MVTKTGIIDVPSEITEAGEWLNVIMLLYSLISSAADILKQIQDGDIKPADFNGPELRARVQKVLDSLPMAGKATPEVDDEIPTGN